MKSGGLPLLSLVMTASLAAEEASPPKSPKTSARLAGEIRVTLPKYREPPPKVLDQPKDLAVDPDVFVLPKVTVREKRLPTDPDLWLAERGIEQKAMAAYRQSMTDLEWALNSWFIPLVSPPASVRAVAAYKEQKSLADLQRLHRLLGDISATDPQAAAELEKERIKMHQSEYWQNRPAGHGRKK